MYFTWSWGGNFKTKAWVFINWIGISYHVLHGGLEREHEGEDRKRAGPKAEVLFTGQ